MTSHLDPGISVCWEARMLGDWDAAVCSQLWATLQPCVSVYWVHWVLCVY